MRGSGPRGSSSSRPCYGSDGDVSDGDDDAARPSSASRYRQSQSRSQDRNPPESPSILSKISQLSTVRNITSNLGHVDGRSLRDDSLTDTESPALISPTTMADRSEGGSSPEDTPSAKDPVYCRSQSFVNKRLLQSMNAFMINENASMKHAAQTLKTMQTPSDRKRSGMSVTSKRERKYVGMVPTAPIRDQPVGSPGDGINLRFRYKLTNLRRKVVNERDGKSKVVRFNESRMAKFGFLAVWQGTVFAKPSAPFIWIQLTSLWILAMLSFGISYVGTKYTSSIIGWDTYRLTHEDNIQEVWEVLDEFRVVADTAQVLTTLVSFLLGLYVTKTVDIWWNMRHELLQSVLNTIDSMCCRLAIYFPGNNDEDEDAKETVLRYGVLSLKLLFKDAREVDSWNISDRKRLGCDNLMDLVEEGLLLPHERELLRDCPSRSQVIWVWIASLFTKWCLDGRLPNPLENQNTILEECNTARNNISMILARVNTQYPMSYSHLVITMVKMLLVIQALVAGYIFNLSVWTGYYYWMATQAVYLIVWTIFHQAMIDIKEHITNPFRENPCDFSEMIQSARTLNSCRAFFKAGKHPPYTTKAQTNPAALPPQLIVRQIISSRLKSRRPHAPGASPTSPSPTNGF